MEKLRFLAYYFVYYLGILWGWKRIANKERPLIVYFHDVIDQSDDVSWSREPSLRMPLELFRILVQYMARHYTIMDLDEAWKTKKSSVAAITFDDGFRGVYRRAFPILRNLKISATIFLTTDYLESRKLPWWEILLYQISQISSFSEDRRIEVFSRMRPRWKEMILERSAEKFLTNYKIASSEEREELKALLDAKVGFPASPKERIFISKSEVQEMLRDGICFGSHTKTHPLLTWLDSRTLMEELQNSQSALVNMTGKNRCWFAYPDGVFSEREMKAVQDAGYVGAVQTFRRPEFFGRFCVPRVGLSVGSISGPRGGLSRARIAINLAGFTKQRLKSFLSLVRGRH